MSAISRATLRATIRNRGDYTNTRRFTNDYLNTEIQNAFGKFWELIANLNEGWWDTSATAATVSGTAYLTLPDNCWRVRAVDRLEGSEYVEMPQVGLSERNKYGSSTGKPLAHRLSARGIDMFPTPNAAYTLRVTYTPLAPTLDESTAREWYNGWEDYVIEEALLQLDTREQRPLGDRITKLQKIEARIKEGASERRASEPEYLRLCEGIGDSILDDGILG